MGWTPMRPQLSAARSTVCSALLYEVEILQLNVLVWSKVVELYSRKNGFE